jgi:outer membrane immunogenic protein
LAAEPYAPPVYDWSGFYVGVHAGYGWDETGLDEAPAGWTTEISDGDGILGGAQAGFNFQTGSFVFGVEGDVSGADISRTYSFDDGGGNDFDLESSLDWLVTIRGRLGFAFDNFLIYGTGGYARAGSETTLVGTVGGAAVSQTSDDDFDGWAAGGGIEYGFSENLSARAEYLYVELDVDDANGISFDPEAHAARFGLNYRF